MILAVLTDSMFLPLAKSLFPVKLMQTIPSKNEEFGQGGEGNQKENHHSLSDRAESLDSI